MSRQTEYINSSIYKYHDIEKKRLENRYVGMPHRMHGSAVGADAWVGIIEAQAFTRWKGVNFLKTIFETQMYPRLIVNEKIRTVIEFGCATGADLCYLSEQVLQQQWKNEKTVIQPVNFIGIDPAQDAIHPICKQNQEKLSVEYVANTTFNAEQIFESFEKRGLQHPWLVIEDAHFGCKDVLQAFKLYARTGDYIIIEDTNPNYHVAKQNSLVKSQLIGRELSEEDQVAHDKGMIVRDFFLDETDLLIDTFYQDYFGYNALKGSNGVIRKCNVSDNLDDQTPYDV